jgi:predicted nucleic acid-binding protein
MNAIDTNVLIYRLDRRDLVKRSKARDLLQHLSATPTSTVLLWQVAGEFVRQLRSWKDQGQINQVALEAYVNVLRNLFPLSMPNPNVLSEAIRLADRYSLSHWDSMLLAACIEAQVDTLYTEDMGAPLTIEGIQLINPFV